MRRRTEGPDEAGADAATLRLGEQEDPSQEHLVAALLDGEATDRASGLLDDLVHRWHEALEKSAMLPRFVPCSPGRHDVRPQPRTQDREHELGVGFRGGPQRDGSVPRQPLAHPDARHPEAGTQRVYCPPLALVAVQAVEALRGQGGVEMKLREPLLARQLLNAMQQARAHAATPDVGGYVQGSELTEGCDDRRESHDAAARDGHQGGLFFSGGILAVAFEALGRHGRGPVVQYFRRVVGRRRPVNCGMMHVEHALSILRRQRP